ncbi:MAG: hypothetical protein QM765_52790 [Myxococcales bacterium]
MAAKTAAAGSMALALLLAAAPAQARFGKHSESSSSKDDDSDSKKHEAEPAPPQGSDSGGSRREPHQAMPANSPSYSESHGDGPHDGGGRDHGHDHHPGRRPLGSHHGGYHYGWGFGYHPYFDAPSPAPDAVVEEDGGPSLTATLGVSGQLHNQSGLSLGIDASVEGERWGVRAAFVGIFVPAEGAQPATELDTINLVDLHLTYAVLSGVHGRLRLEAGATAAFAPDVIFLAPDAGISGAVGLVGPLGLEASVSYTPWPFQRVDATAGLSLTWGSLGVKAGWRHLWLDDRGAVDGVRHTDTFTGPFVGLGVAF